MVFTPPSVPLLGDRNLPYLFSKTYPSFLTIKEGFFESLRLPLAKGSSTFLTKPLFPQGREDVTALRCSEPLRYKVGGPSKVFARFCGLGPPGDSLLIEESVYAILCGLGPPGDNGLLDGADWRSLGIVGEFVNE